MSTNSGSGNMNYPPPPPPKTEVTSNATKAALCAIIPGVGAVYNQDYMKAVVHLAAFSSLCIFAEANGIFGLIAFVFYIYTIFDAYRSASISPVKKEPATGQMNLPLWGILLILLGVVFLLDSLNAISLRSITQFWPLVLVFLGAYLVFQYVSGEKRNQPGAGTGAGNQGRYQPVETPPSAVSSETGDSPPADDGQNKEA